MATQFLSRTTTRRIAVPPLRFPGRPTIKAISRSDWDSKSFSRHFSHSRPRRTSKDDFFQVSEEVQDAIRTGKPVVALETTIYTHGWAYPSNVALASHLESLVRVNGGVPATIGVLNGVAKVGMSPEEIIDLTASTDQKETWKISRRDLGFIAGMGIYGRPFNGGTTIAGTMVLAHLAGIKIFATGGLGGVHRGGENSLDISADLTELGRTPVTVISSGCKSFLDIPRTLEYLETQGVGVGTFADGRSGPVDFPAFFSRDSGTRSPKTIKNEAEAAAIVFAQSRFPLHSGLHFANPVPENSAIEKEEMDAIIAKAVDMAEQSGIGGSENTPFVLRKIKELSGGRSVTANKALVGANVIRGTKVAVELAKLEMKERGILERPSVPFPTIHAQRSYDRNTSHEATTEQGAPAISADVGTATAHKPIDIVVAGSIASDLICDYSPLSGFDSNISPTLHTKNPSHFSSSTGGVGRNVAYAAHLAGASVILSSVVADDQSGLAVLASLEKDGMDKSGIMVLDSASSSNSSYSSPPSVSDLGTTMATPSTAQYVAINDAKKNLYLAMSDFSIFSSSNLTSSEHWDALFARTRPQWVVVDGNWSADILSQIIRSAKNGERKVLQGSSDTPRPLIAFEPVSAEKSSRLFIHPSSVDTNAAEPLINPSTIYPNHTIDLLTPNTHELTSIYNVARGNTSSSQLFDSPAWWELINSFNLSPSGSRDRFLSILSGSGTSGTSGITTGALASANELIDQGIPQQTIQLLPFFPCILTKLGAYGCLLAQILPPHDTRLRDPAFAPWILGRNTTTDITGASTGSGGAAAVGGIYLRRFPPSSTLTDADIVNVNGVGDSLLGVLVAGFVKQGQRGQHHQQPQRQQEPGRGNAAAALRLEEIIPLAQRAAVYTLRSQESVGKEISGMRGDLGAIGS